MLRADWRHGALTEQAAYAGGMGFVDALHAATAATMSVDFRTFDTGLAGKAGTLLGISVLVR